MGRAHRGRVIAGGVGYREHLSVHRVNPLLGRYTTEEDAKPGAPWALVLSYKVWNKHC